MAGQLVGFSKQLPGNQGKAGPGNAGPGKAGPGWYGLLRSWPGCSAVKKATALRLKGDQGRAVEPECWSGSQCCLASPVPCRLQPTTLADCMAGCQGAGPVSFKGPQVTAMLQLAAIGLPGWAAQELQGLMGRVCLDLLGLTGRAGLAWTYGALRAWWTGALVVICGLQTRSKAHNPSERAGYAPGL